MATKSSEGIEDILGPIFSNNGELKLKCHFRASKLLKFSPVGILLSVQATWVNLGIYRREGKMINDFKRIQTLKSYNFKYSTEVWDG